MSAAWRSWYFGSVIVPPSLCGHALGGNGGERLHRHRRNARLAAMRVIPGEAHFGLYGLRVERPADAFDNAGAEGDALAFGNAAADQLIAPVFFSVLPG